MRELHRRAPRAVSLRLAAVAPVAAALLLSACGGEDERSALRGDGAAAPQRAPGDRLAGGEQRRQGRRTDDRARSRPAPRDTSDSFTPREHEDSGGGAEQFRIEGGDNSVQEFGSEATGSDFERAAAALHGFLDARAQGAWAAACSHLAASVTESLRQLAVPEEGGQEAGCAALLARLTNRAALPALRKEARRADVGSLRIDGERALAIYRGLGDTIMTLPMSEEDGEWKVAALAGVPLN